MENRTGNNAGRIPDSIRDRHRISAKFNVSMDADLFDRLEQYCLDEERTRSWVIAKAVNEWLTNKNH